ncbi:MAG: DUF423 domain-containing protein [Saprospiraceae bacterium]|nr:DUF423 domain-containing protein [Saprospiraceae bacterium]MBK8670794.1 DUF423 domain-containing protein [Saprospiraceae bacterium]MBL0101550.1 DUF423 domain-containing protein [Saprospiraceae bacterium]
MYNKVKIAAVTGALAVAIGAFGAHGLKPLMTESQLETFRTGGWYHILHVMPLLMIALISPKNKILNQSFYLFLGGIICFSGSLYILSTKHLAGGEIWNFVGPVTPLGGLFFIAAWLNMWRYKGDKKDN